LAEIMKTTKDPQSGASVAQSLSAVKDFQSFLGSKLTCDGKQWPNSSACTSALVLLQAQDDASLKPITPNNSMYPIKP
jgi:branched-chain amino acid transport system substrate-binding protein